MPPSLILPEYAPIHNVVFVMEDTASAGPYIQEMKSNYVGPILDYFTDNGQKVVLPYASIKCTSTFTLIVYHCYGLKFLAWRITWKFHSNILYETSKMNYKYKVYLFLEQIRGLSLFFENLSFFILCYSELFL